MAYLNDVLRDSLGRIGFEWTSLQINVDTVSDSHVDKNNTGLSAVLLLGRFTGGEFKMTDGSLVVSQTGLMSVRRYQVSRVCRLQGKARVNHCLSAFLSSSANRG